jgi:GTPase involved in cell partitioning and DNA repair
VITFRRISSQEAFKKLVKFLTDDVEANGGSASEIVNMHGTLVHVTVCKVPGGTCLIHKEITKLEAIAWWMQDPD